MNIENNKESFKSKLERIVFKEVFIESDIFRICKLHFYSFSAGLVLGKLEKYTMGEPYVSGVLLGMNFIHSSSTYDFPYLAGVGLNYINEISNSFQ